MRSSRKTQIKLFAITIAIPLAGYFAVNHILTSIWSDYGTSILKRTKRVVYNDVGKSYESLQNGGDGSEGNIVVCEGDPRFIPVKDWIHKNLFNLLYVSWWIQTLRNEIPTHSVTMYSEITPSDPQTGYLEYMFICSETMGVSDNEVKHKHEELFNILNSNQN